MHECSRHARTHSDGAIRRSDFWTRFDDAVADSLVRTMPVIPIEVASQAAAQCGVAEEPEVVGELLLDAPEHSFAMCIHIWRPRRGDDDFHDVCGGDDAIETGIAERAITVVEQEAGAPLLEDAIVHGHRARDVAHDHAIWVWGDGGDMDTSRSEMNGDQDIDGADTGEGDDGNRDEVTGHKLAPVRGAESFPFPRPTSAFWCNGDTVALENVGDGALAEPGSVHAQHAQNLPVAPGGAATGDGADESFDPAADARPSWSAWLGLSLGARLPLDQVPEPATYGAEGADEQGFGGLSPTERMGGVGDGATFLGGEGDGPGPDHGAQNAHDGDQLDAKQGVLGAQRGFACGRAEEGEHGRSRMGSRTMSIISLAARKMSSYASDWQNRKWDVGDVIEFAC